MNQLQKLHNFLHSVTEAREAKKLAKENARNAVKQVDFDSITTVKALKEVVKQLIEAQKEE